MTMLFQARSSATLTPPTFNPISLAQHLQHLIQSHLNGCIEIRSNQGQWWTLDFRVGRLCWATGGDHRWRRWRRLQKVFCPDIVSQNIRIRETDFDRTWEHLALSVYIKRQLITRATAVSMTQTNLVEIVIDLLLAAAQIETIAVEINIGPAAEQPIIILSLNDILNQALQLYRNWIGTGLGSYSPNLAPIILEDESLQRQMPPVTYRSLQQVLFGQLSLREIAATTKQDISALGRYLVPYVLGGEVGLRSLPDYANPYGDIVIPEQGSPHQASSIEAMPLIICIDDSPQVSYLLEQILQPQGYRVLAVQDAIYALSVLLKQKPDLIFLDFTMPVVQGPELCSQLRRTTQFKKTPIIFLTGQSGLISRAQALSAGATDFLSKPIVPDQITAIVKKYVPRSTQLSAAQI